jgi:hypothetical protein
MLQAAVTPIRLVAHVGRWSQPLPAAMSAIPVSPPGLRAEALVGDWTMSGWLRGAADQVMVGDPGWATAALLYRRSGPVDDNPSASPWSLYVECRTQRETPSETVRIWLGPFGRSITVLRVSSSGAVSDERAGDVALKGATVSRVGGKWFARIPIPERCIDADGTFRIGIERKDALGRRSAWPRAMLPWQSEPGRIIVDTRAWTTVEPDAPTPSAEPR